MLDHITDLGNSDPLIAKNSLLKILDHLRIRKDDENEIKYITERLTRGLQSQKVSTRKGFYTALVTILSLKRGVTPSLVIAAVKKLLVTSGQTTKAERRLIYTARILALGAVVRCNQLTLPTDIDLLHYILTEMSDVAGKKLVYLELSSPFICHIFSSYNEEQLQLLNIDCIHALIKSQKEISLSLLQIAMSMNAKNISVSLLENVQSVIESILKVSGDQIQSYETVLRHFIDFIASKNLFEEFWEIFITNQKPSHFGLLCISLEESIIQKCPLKLVLKEEIVSNMLKLFRTSNTGAHLLAKQSFSHLLDWKSENVIDKKHRKKGIKVLFKGTPNVLHEYKKLSPILRHFLECCSSKELASIASICLENLNNSENGVRYAAVNVQFLIRISQRKKISCEKLIEISQRLFNFASGTEKLLFGAPKSDSEVNQSSKPEVDETDEELIKRRCIEGLQSILSASFNVEFTNAMMDHAIHTSSSDASEKEELKNKFKELKKCHKLMKKINDTHLPCVLGSCALYWYLETFKSFPSPKYHNVLEEAKELCQDEPGTKKTEFIIDTISPLKQAPFNFEKYFSRLLIENRVKKNELSIIASAIDIDVGEEMEEESVDSAEEMKEDDGIFTKSNGVTENGDKASEEEDDCDDSDADDDSDSEIENGDDSDENDVEDGDEMDIDDEGIEIHANAEDNSGESEDIDMDDASESDLQQMDKALANVFATKKAMKDEQSGEQRSLMRAVRLLSMYMGRHKTQLPKLSKILQLPLENCLKYSTASTNNDLTAKIKHMLNAINSKKTKQKA